MADINEISRPAPLDPAVARPRTLPVQRHTAICEAGKHPVLSATRRSTMARVESVRLRGNRNDAEWQRAVCDREAMVEALAARDGAAPRVGRMPVRRAHG
jgi:hypothetical protein